MSDDMGSMCPKEADIREIWRKVPGDHYSPHIEVFDNNNAVRISVGGSVITMSVEAWHRAGSFETMAIRAEVARLQAQVSEQAARVEKLNQDMTAALAYGDRVTQRCADAEQSLKTANDREQALKERVKELSEIAEKYEDRYFNEKRLSDLRLVDIKEMQGEIDKAEAEAFRKQAGIECEGRHLAMAENASLRSALEIAETALETILRVAKSMAELPEDKHTPQALKVCLSGIVATAEYALFDPPAEKPCYCNDEHVCEKYNYEGDGRGGDRL